MAIYHLSVKAISRSAGRSSTAAAAYRAGCGITDKRTGLVHDYSRKRGVESADIVLPIGAPKWAADRSALWNAAEAAERRKDSCVAREFEVALPSELSPVERRRLALDFAKEMANHEGCAVDVAIHAPGKNGDNRNHHAHILRTTRKIGTDGLTDKIDTEKSGRHRREDLEAVRERWAELTNERLLENKIEARIDHRNLKDQGIDRPATVHLGPAVTSMAKRGANCNVLIRIQIEAAERLAVAKRIGELDREAEHLQRGLIILSADIDAAKREIMAEKMAHVQNSEQMRKSGGKYSERVETLIKISMYARYCELMPHSPSGVAFKKVLSTAQRIVPKSLQAVEGHRFTDRRLMEFSAKELYRDGLISKIGIESVGINLKMIDPLDDDEALIGRATSSQAEMRSVLDIDSDKTREGIESLKSAIYDSLSNISTVNGTNHFQSYDTIAVMRSRFPIVKNEPSENSTSTTSIEKHAIARIIKPAQ